MSQDVTLDRVTMRFGDFVAVQGVSLRIEPGEFFAFLGPSGCGKTTILRLVSGFIEPSEGTVRIGGRRQRITNLEKVLYPETGTTKGEVIDYYSRIAEALIPHVVGRPVTRKGWPDGVGRDCVECHRK